MSTPPPFFTRYGLHRTGDPTAPLTIEPYAEICQGGVLRPAVIVAAVDIVGSFFTREIAGSDQTFTTDLSVRAPARVVPGCIRAHGELLRQGRTMITTAVRLESLGEPFAYGETTFMRVPHSTPPEPDRMIGMPEVIPFHPLERPLAEEVGIRVEDAGQGLVSVELREAICNGGVMQGALVALLAEVAAETLATHTHGSPQIVAEVDVRYLSVAKRGPVIAQAYWVGAPEQGMLRAELRDGGREGRITAAVLLRTAPAVSP